LNQARLAMLESQAGTQQKVHPERQEVYETKLAIAKKLLETWVKAHPGEQRPVTLTVGSPTPPSVSSCTKRSTCPMLAL